MGQCQPSGDLIQNIKNATEEDLQRAMENLDDAKKSILKASLGKKSGPKAEKKATGTSVAIIYYSMYGHIDKMAEEIKKGLEKAGISVDVFQVPETLDDEVLAKMGAPPKNFAVPTLDYEMVGKLHEYDGFVFGIPTRFGVMSAQMKAFFDMTGSHWMKQSLSGKPAATFVSTGTQNGGQELTHMQTLSCLAHHGMPYVSFGYQGGAPMFSVDEIHGASPWGASTLAAGDGSRQPSAMELQMANLQGEKFGEAVKRTKSKPVTRKCKVGIVYYTTYGHVKKMVDKIAQAMEAEGVEVRKYQAKETLPEGVLKAMGAPPKSSDKVIEHSNIEELAELDGIMMGLPTRFGQPAAQIKNFWDATGGLWQGGKLVGKLASSFVSTGTPQGGQETTHLTHLTNFVHHGMIYVPFGYSDSSLLSMEELHGGSPWGASTYAGATGARQPSETELKIAAAHGKAFAAKVKQMAV
ncbi:unnamed protein product [Durusdinium trenchii]|uniref:Quinone-oxidoreductase QR2 (TvQR2) n=2 Tax=Durusdinium trenchii TaxID=1381693 RepID=A0ABP0JTN0_9DINO